MHGVHNAGVPTASLLGEILPGWAMQLSILIPQAGLSVLCNNRMLRA